MKGIVDTEPLFEEPVASKMEEKRNIARKRHRIMYDCLNAEVDISGTKVTCPLHKLNSRDGNYINILEAIRGYTPRVCQHCLDYKFDPTGCRTSPKL